MKHCHLTIALVCFGALACEPSEPNECEGLVDGGYVGVALYLEGRTFAIAPSDACDMLVHINANQAEEFYSQFDRQDATETQFPFVTMDVEGKLENWPSDEGGQRVFVVDKLISLDRHFDQLQAEQVLIRLGYEVSSPNVDD